MIALLLGVLGDGNPDVLAVGVDAAGVVHVALAQDDVLLEVALVVHDEQVSDALAGCAVVAALRGGVLDGRLDDLDRRKEDPVTGEGDALGVEGGEVQLELAGQLPLGVAVEGAEVGCQGGVAGLLRSGNTRSLSCRVGGVGGGGANGGQGQGQPGDQGALGGGVHQNLFTVGIPEDLVNVCTRGELPETFWCRCLQHVGHVQRGWSRSSPRPPDKEARRSVPRLDCSCPEPDDR